MTAEQALDAIIEDDELNKIIAGFISHHPEYNSIERMNLPEQEIKHRCEIEKIKREKLLKEMQESWENHTRQELNRLAKESKIIKEGNKNCEINHPPKSYFGKSYDELRNEIKQRFRYKEKEYSGIVAVFCNTEEEFDFVKYFYTIAHSGCANIYKIKIDTEYSGPDWYFYESKDYGYGYGSDHWMETLTQKKQKFAKFVAEYE